MKTTRLVLLFLVIAVGFFLLQEKSFDSFFQGDQGMESAEHGDHDHDDEHYHKGPHGGRLFSEGDLQLEVTIFESGVPPEFRIYASNNAGQTITSPALKLSIELRRLGGRIDKFSFKPMGEFFRGQGIVEEPHSYEALVKADWNNQSHQWKFSQKEAEVTIVDEMAELSGIEWTKAGPAKLETVIALTGEVGLDETKVAHVVPRLDAVVSQVIKHLGDQVKKGEPLALLESRDLAEAKSRYLKARQQAEPIFLDLEREKLLFKNVIKMLGFLKEEVALETLDEQLRGMILGETRSQLIPAYAKLKHAKSVYQREKSLFAKKISSKSELLLAEEQYQTARANFNALREKIAFANELRLLKKSNAAEKAGLDIETSSQQLLALGITHEEIEQLTFQDDPQFTLYPLKSPLTGEVIQKHLAVGEAVKKDDDILVVANLSKVWVNIAVPAKELSHVRLGQTVRVTEEHQGLQAEGVLDYLGSVINETTRSVTGRIVIANPRRQWRPGMYVSVSLVQEEARVSVAVPRSSIQTIRDWKVVFVKYGNVYQARPIETGRSNGTFVEVLKGLKPDEPYVSKNSFAIKAELEKSGARHDH